MANGYSYADNNPVLKVDPDGTWAWVAVRAGYGSYTGYNTTKSRGYKGWRKWGYTAYSAASSATGFGRAFKAGKALYSFSKKSTRPPNLSPKGAGRRGAFRTAKRKMGIPMSQHLRIETLTKGSFSIAKRWMMKI